LVIRIKAFAIKVESDRDSLYPVIVYANGPTQFFGGLLHLPETIVEQAIKIGPCIVDPDHGATAVEKGLYTYAFVTGTLYNPVKKIPQNVSQHIFIRLHREFMADIVYDQAAAADRLRQQSFY
jgi:hypothetical protein